MFRLQFVVAAVIAALLVGCVSQEQYRRALADNDNLRSQRDSQKDYLSGVEAENARLRARVTELEALMPDKEWLDAQRARAKSLLDDLSAKGGLPSGVTMESVAGGVVFSVEGEVLFASGKAELTAEGQRTLTELARTLVAQNKKMRVEGHTDSDPIQRSQWGSNLRLSVERAFAVVEFLKSVGIPADLLSVAGYGEHAPRVANEDSDGKRRNRRVEILLRNDS